MNTGRLDALLLIAVTEETHLWFGIVLNELWDQWRAECDSAGGNYLAVPYNAVSSHVIATPAPHQKLKGVYRVPAEQATIEMQKRMALAIEAGWPGKPEVSAEWTKELDRAEQELRGSEVPWTWPTES